MLAIRDLEVAVYGILWNVIIIKMIILLVKYEWIVLCVSCTVDNA